MKAKFILTTDTHYGHSYKTHRRHEVFLEEISQKIKEEKVDALIHTGDWISCSQHQLPRTLKMFRKAVGDLPILTVWGNHDLWDKGSYFDRKQYGKRTSFMEMETNKAEWCAEYNIHHLARKPFFVKDTVVLGFDGWYHSIPPNTNDVNFMPKQHNSAPINLYLNNQAYKDLDWALEEAENLRSNNSKLNVIMATHMPSYSKDPRWSFMSANPRFMEEIVLTADTYCVGHSHQSEDFIYTSEDGHSSMRVINAGTYFTPLNHGYDAPRYTIFE